MKSGFAFKFWVYFLCVSFLLLANRFHTMIAEAEEMSRPLDEMVSVKERVDKLIEEPRIGQKIYILSSRYISHGQDDIAGGLVTITEVK